MGAGIHGGFGNTKGYREAVAGNAIFVSGNKLYFIYMSRRKDIDEKGEYDVVAHGNPKKIYVTHNGKDIEINSRIAAKLIKSRDDYNKNKRQSIRLLSCNTGKGKNSFAQNLANKMGVTVYAPTKMIWAWPNGTHGVYGAKKNNINEPDLKDKGYMKAFYPRRGK